MHVHALTYLTHYIITVFGFPAPPSFPLLLPPSCPRPVLAPPPFPLLFGPCSGGLVGRVGWGVGVSRLVAGRGFREQGGGWLNQMGKKEVLKEELFDR